MERGHHARLQTAVLDASLKGAATALVALALSAFSLSHFTRDCQLLFFF
jgi:hypothetical protein